MKKSPRQRGLLQIKFLRMSKVNYLFDMAKLVQRPIPEQREFEITHFDFLTAIPVLTTQAFELTTAERKSKTPLSVNRMWFANTMNGNLLALVAAEFPEYVRSTGRGSHCLLLDNKYECYLKKLTNSLFPSYNHSKTSRALCNQEAMNEKDALPIIYIGYRTNKSKDDLKGFYAVCIKGKERLWKSDLTAIEPPNAETWSDTSPNLPLAPEVKVTVKVKRKTSE